MTHVCDRNPGNHWFGESDGAKLLSEPIMSYCYLGLKEQIRVKIR